MYVMQHAKDEKTKPHSDVDGSPEPVDAVTRLVYFETF